MIIGHVQNCMSAGAMEYEWLGWSRAESRGDPSLVTKCASESESPECIPNGQQPHPPPTPPLFSTKKLHRTHRTADSSLPLSPSHFVRVRPGPRRGRKGWKLKFREFKHLELLSQSTAPSSQKINECGRHRQCFLTRTGPIWLNHL